MRSLRTQRDRERVLVGANGSDTGCLSGRDWRHPSAHRGDQLPVESVTWDDVLKYCHIIGGNLPSEIEWEYAAHAGTMGTRYGSQDAVAWHSGNSSGTNQPVGQKQPNAFGLYDMLGNVWEWMEDSYEDTPSKILRGGSSFDAALTRGPRAVS
jgi:sulfatase modifying factor 1